MKIEKLYYFLSVAKHRNFTKAAKECHIAQPAISKQMLSLEKELGFLLFERKNRKVELTDAGQEFYKSISCLIEEYEASIRRVQQLPEEANYLCIGISNFSDSALLSSALEQLKKDSTNLQLEVKTVCSSSADQWLMERSCDVAFTWYELNDLPEELESQVVAERDCELLLSAKHPLAEKEEVCIDDLSGERLLLPVCPHCQRFTDFYLSRMKELVIPVGDCAIARDNDSLTFMLEGNVGVAIVPQGVFREHGGNIVSKTIRDCGSFGQWKAVYRKDNPNKMIHSLLALLEQ